MALYDWLKKITEIFVFSCVIFLRKKSITKDEICLKCTLHYFFITAKYGNKFPA